MYADLILIPFEECLLVFGVFCLATPLVHVIFSRDDTVVTTAKEVLGFLTIFGSIYWYTLDPSTKKAIKLALLSTDVKLTEDGLSYKPFVGVPLTVVISERAGRPTVGIRVGGGFLLGV